MKKLTQKYAILAVGLTAIIAGVYFFVLEPLTSKRQAIVAETTVANAKLADYQNTMTTINDYLKRKRELQSQKDALTARLYNKKEVVALVKHLKISAQQKDLSVREITPSLSELLALNSLPPADGSPRYLDIAMRYTGSYRDATLFLAELEGKPMFVKLLSVNIISREDGRIPAEYRIRFTSMIGGVGDTHAQRSSSSVQKQLMAVGTK